MVSYLDKPMGKLMVQMMDKKWVEWMEHKLESMMVVLLG